MVCRAVDRFDQPCLRRNAARALETDFDPQPAICNLGHWVHGDYFRADLAGWVLELIFSSSAQHGAFSWLMTCVTRIIQVKLSAITATLIIQRKRKPRCKTSSVVHSLYEKFAATSQPSIYSTDHQSGYPQRRHRLRLHRQPHRLSC